MKLLFHGITIVFALYTISSATITPRISFGTRAKQGMWPSQVLMITGQGKGRICGGAIISNQWVLAASHCVRKDEDGAPHNPLSYKLYFGTYDRFKPSRSQVMRGIAKIIQHPQYEAQNHSHDIALVKMDKPLNFNGAERHLKPMCLDLNGHVFNAIKRADCYVTGFGRTSNELIDNENLPSYLMQLQMKPYSHKRCKKMHEEFYAQYTSKEAVTDLQMCMVSKAYGGRNPSRGGVCPGDSGGPLQCKLPGRNPSWYQVGVIWSITNCDTAPSVFQVVHKYANFIRKISDYRLPAYCSQ